MKVIKRTLMSDAEKLSAEWDNTAFIVINTNGSLEAIVWNNYQYEKPQRPYVAAINGNDGWQMNDEYKEVYSFEVGEAERAFSFWKENKIDQEYTLTVSKLKEKYLEFLKTKDKEWIVYYGHNSVHAFIGDSTGLNSVTEQTNTEDIENILMSVRHEYINALDQ